MKKGKPQEQDVLSIIPTEHPITRRNIIKALQESEQFEFFSDGHIDQKLRSLEAQGKIQSVGHGEYQQFHNL